MFGTWIGVVLLFIVFGLFVWAIMGMMTRGDDYEQKRAAARFEKLKTTREEASNALTGYAWVDKAKGTVRVPIERAMQLTVADLANKKPTAAGPIATPAPGAQAAAPTTAMPAPSPSVTPAGTPPASSVTGPNSENRGQKAAENNPPNAPPGTQPGPSATPAASEPVGANRPHPGPGLPTATPMQTAPGTPIPVRPQQP